MNKMMSQILSILKTEKLNAAQKGLFASRELRNEDARHWEGFVEGIEKAEEIIKKVGFNV